MQAQAECYERAKRQNIRPRAANMWRSSPGRGRESRGEALSSHGMVLDAEGGGEVESQNRSLNRNDAFTSVSNCFSGVKE